MWSVKKTGKELVAEVKPHPKSWADYSLGLAEDTWKDVDVDKYIDDLRNEWG